jgi:hypothetical protein
MWSGFQLLARLHSAATAADAAAGTGATIDLEPAEGSQG